MGDDVKILAVAAAAASVGRRGRARARRLDRDAARPAPARHRRSVAAGDLAVRAPEDGPRELAELGRAFNEMAASLRAPLRRPPRARRRRKPRPAHAGRLDRRDARGDGRRARASRTSTSGRCATRRGGSALLVDDLFELARIDAGALALELRVACARRRSCESCLSGLEAEARARNVQLERRGDDHGDARRRCAPGAGRARPAQPADERAPAHAVRRNRGGRRLGRRASTCRVIGRG